MPRVTVEVWSSLSSFFQPPAPGKLPRKLLFDVEFDVEIEGPATLDRLLRHLAAGYPDFSAYMYDPRTGEPSEAVSVVVNDRVPELLAGYQTPLKDGDRVTLVQAYAGG
jgi:molybdopterin converting factor small subunit